MSFEQISAKEIYENESLYGFLVRYFVDELYETRMFEKDELTKADRWAISQLMASWLSFEQCYAAKVRARAVMDEVAPSGP